MAYIYLFSHLCHLVVPKFWKWRQSEAESGTGLTGVALSFTGEWHLEMESHTRETVAICCTFDFVGLTVSLLHNN